MIVCLYVAGMRVHQKGVPQIQVCDWLKKALSESHRSIWAGQWDFHDT